MIKLTKNDVVLGREQALVSFNTIHKVIAGILKDYQQTIDKSIVVGSLLQHLNPLAERADSPVAIYTINDGSEVYVNISGLATTLSIPRPELRVEYFEAISDILSIPDNLDPIMRLLSATHAANKSKGLINYKAAYTRISEVVESEGDLFAVDVLQKATFKEADTDLATQGSVEDQQIRDHVINSVDSHETNLPRGIQTLDVAPEPVTSE